MHEEPGAFKLTFDFSGVRTRQDYYKIVIQIGGEGHTGEGIFFSE